MSPIKQQQAIAESCGWTDIQDPHFMSALMKTPVGRVPGGDSLGGFTSIPDYLGSLEAINSAVASLPYDRQPVYIHKLTFTVMMKEEGVSDFERHLATAPQRAEAYLRTIDKWEEQP